MSKTSAIMIFVFGLALLLIGIPLFMIKEEVTKYQYVSTGLGNIRIPTGIEQIHPFQSIAVILMFVGLILTITGIVIPKRDKSFSKVSDEKLNFNQKEPTHIIACGYCGTIMPERAVFCASCGNRIE